MAGYRTEQINIGSIAAPDVGKALIDYAGLTNDYYQQGLSNTKAGIELARQQVADQRSAELFNRQTNEYNREVGLRKAKQDITKDFMNNQSAYGGQPLHDRLNDAINAESQRRLSTPEVGELDALVARQDKGETLTPQELARKDEIAKKITFSPEESTRLQKESESIVPFQEDAKAMLAAKYAAAGIDNAHALAADATGGLISRAALQEQADKNREVNQKYYDELLKARREYGKDLIEVDKVNAKAENDKAEKVFEMLKTVYGIGGGTGSGSSGGGIGGVTLADAQKAVEGLDLGWSDTGDAYKLLNKGIAEGLTPGQTLKAIKNARDVGVTAGISASKIDEKLFDAQIENAKKFGIPGQAGYDVTKISNRLNEADYAPTYIPRERVGYDTKEMDARIARNLPFLHAGQPEVPTKGGVERNIVTRMPDSLVKSEGVKTNPYDDGKGNITVGVGYNMSGKSRSEIEADFKDANIPVDKIDKLLKRDGTQLTTKEVSDLANVSYDKYGVKKLANIGIDISKLNPALAEIGVSQAFRGDIVKNGEGYRGKLYNYLKDNDLAGMVDYIQNNNVPKEVKTRLNNVIGIGKAGAEGPIGEEQYKYNKSRLDKLLVTDNKAELDKLLASHPAPTKDVLDRVTELSAPQNVVTPGEQIKTSMRTSGLGPMSESSKQQWNVISNILKSSTKIPRDVLVDVYNKYQENIGMPFAEFVKQYTPGGNR